MTDTIDPRLDVEGARIIWNQIFDVTSEQADRLYEEAYEKLDGYYSAVVRIRDRARALGFGSGPARFALLLGDGSWHAGSGAALARLLRPAIGQKDGISQADYDLVTKPWSVVIGQVHPDDPTVTDPTVEALNALINDFRDGTESLGGFLVRHGVTVKGVGP